MLKFKKTNDTSLNVKAPDVPKGLWMKCDNCGEMIYKEDVVKHKFICYKCGKYFRLITKTRLRMIVDSGSFAVWDEGINTPDPLEYPEYKEKLAELKEKYNLDEAVTCGTGTIHGEQAVICVCDGRFLMGSMGYVYGEKITRAIERATELKLPLIIFTCSGGARMQEGSVSLMQMAKTSSALKKHSNQGLLYISVLTDPTTGGVTASFAMLGDIILAEPGALVGFAGPRVIEQTIGQKLPEGFQRAEFLLDHGLIDSIVERENIKDTLAQLIVMHQIPPGETKFIPRKQQFPIPKTRSTKPITAWERVKRARDNRRPTALDYINEIFTSFYELHGDRHYGDDGATIGGIAYLDGYPVTVIGQQKGRTTRENVTRNFGMSSPEGYRKTLRIMKQAEKFHRPIICFVDTPGAFCGIEAEQHGQGEAIARNLFEMSDLTTPILSIIIGEGGSGGALALAVGNEVWMMENAVYSILSPEGFASILWKDAKRAKEAAQSMKMTAQELLELGIIDKIIYEKQTLTTDDMQEIISKMSDNIRIFLNHYSNMEAEALITQRYTRFRNM
jgi:acetyl-CoA carboxylase carboxyl transferase subunit beta